MPEGRISEALAQELIQALDESQDVALGLLPTNEEGVADQAITKNLEKLYKNCRQCVLAKVDDNSALTSRLSTILGMTTQGVLSWCDRLRHPEMKEVGRQIKEELHVALALACSNERTSRENIIKQNGKNR